MSEGKIILKNAMLIVLMIGSFFLFSKIIGQENNPYLRFLNILFVILGIRMAIKENITKNLKTNYTSNYGIALSTSALGVILSSIGVLFYIELINPDFLIEMSNNFLLGGKDLNIYELIFSLVIEGIASSIVGSLIVMQFFKNHKTSKELTA